MSNIADDYTRSLHEQHQMYAAWFPNSCFALGDFGKLEGRYHTIFNQHGNIATTDLFPKVKFKMKSSSSPHSTLTYATQGMVQYDFKPEGEIGTMGVVDIAKGLLDVRFSRDNAVFVYIDKITIESIDDKGYIFEKLLFHYNQGYWKKDYALITDIIKAGNTTVYISGGDDAAVVLEAKVPGTAIPINAGVPINFGNTNIQLRIKSKKNIAFDLTSEPGLTPFMKLYGVFEWPFGIGQDMKPIGLDETTTSPRDIMPQQKMTCFGPIE
jgi:hypothetical protein